MLTTGKFYNDVLFKSIAGRHFTYTAFLPFIAGLFLVRRSDGERLFDAWLIAVLIYILIVARGNQVHEYYQLPIMLPGVVFLGKAFAAGMERGRSRWLRGALVVSLCGTLVLSGLRLASFYRGEDRTATLFQMAESVQRNIAPDERIITVSEGNPVALYACHRKGWTCAPAEITPEYLRQRKQEGARYLVAEKEVFVRNHCEPLAGTLIEQYRPIDTEKGFIIIAL